MGQDQEHVITLVHGTFAKRAPWTRPGSHLRNKLEHELGPAVTFLPFDWPGGNSIKARLTAAKQWASHLELAEREHPLARHSVIARNHGGNIVLRALTVKPRNGTPAAICLSTPFIHPYWRR